MNADLKLYYLTFSYNLKKKKLIQGKKVKSGWSQFDILLSLA